MRHCEKMTKEFSWQSFHTSPKKIFDLLIDCFSPIENRKDAQSKKTKTSLRDFGVRKIVAVLLLFRSLNSSNSLSKREFTMIIKKRSFLEGAIADIQKCKFSKANLLNLTKAQCKIPYLLSKFFKNGTETINPSNNKTYSLFES